MFRIENPDERSLAVMNALRKVFKPEEYLFDLIPIFYNENTLNEKRFLLGKNKKSKQSQLLKKCSDTISKRKRPVKYEFVRRYGHWRWSSLDGVKYSGSNTTLNHAHQLYLFGRKHKREAHPLIFNINLN